MLIHGSELVAVAQGAGGILGLSVAFLGSTIRSQKSERDSRRGMSRASRELLGPRAHDATCGRQVVPQKPPHDARLPPVKYALLSRISELFLPAISLNGGHVDFCPHLESLGAVPTREHFHRCRSSRERHNQRDGRFDKRWASWRVEHGANAGTSRRAREPPRERRGSVAGGTRTGRSLELEFDSGRRCSSGIEWVSGIAIPVALGLRSPGVGTE